MIGQLMLTGFSGQQPGIPMSNASPAICEAESSRALSSGIRISRVPAVARILKSINDAAGEHTPLIAIEQPGGPDTVLSEDKGFTFHSSANAVSSGGNPHEAQVEYRAMADELAGSA